MSSIAKRLAALEALEQAAAPAKQLLDDISGRLKTVDERMKSIRGTRPTDEAERMNLLTQLTGMEAERLGILEEQARAQRDMEAIQGRLLVGEKQRQDLGFLQQQLQVLDLIDQYQLDTKSILGGVGLGLDASPTDLSDVMLRLTTSIMDTINRRIAERTGGRTIDQGAMDRTGSFGERYAVPVVNNYTTNLNTTSVYEDPMTLMEQVRVMQMMRPG